VRGLSKAITAVIFLCNVHGSFSQSDSLPMFRFSSVCIGFGGDYHQRTPSDQRTFAVIAPQNSLCQTNLVGFANLQSPDMLDPTNFYYTAMLGFKRRDKKKRYHFYRENRIGLRFYSSTPLLAVYLTEKNTHYDSLATSANTKGYYYNVRVQNLDVHSFFLKRNNLVLDLGTIYYSAEKRLFKLYGGYTIGLGYSLSSQVIARASTDSIIMGYEYNVLHSAEEVTPIKKSVIYNVSLPAGVEFRFAHTRAFWSRCIVYLEVRAGFNSQYIVNRGNYTRYFFGSHAGFKYFFMK
jgi:hypothetical protein